MPVQKAQEDGEEYIGKGKRRGRGNCCKMHDLFLICKY